MIVVDERTIHGVRFVLDNYGWIWQERRNPLPGEPRWTRTDWSSFERIERAVFRPVS